MENINKELKNLSTLNFDELKEKLNSLQEKPPSKIRDSFISLIYLLMVSKVPNKKAIKYFFSGYSYSRTSRHPTIRQFAEKIRIKFNI